MASQWYIRRIDSNDEKGPFDIRAIQEALDGRALTQRSYVRRNDDPTWYTVKEHPQLDAELQKLRSRRASRSAPQRARTSETRVAANETNDSDKASANLWTFTLISALLYAVVVVAFRSGHPGGNSELLNDADAASRELGYMVGALMGALTTPLIAVGVAALMRTNRKQRILVKVYAVASLVLLALQLVSAASIYGVRTYLERAKQSGSK